MRTVPAPVGLRVLRHDLRREVRGGRQRPRRPRRCQEGLRSCSEGRKGQEEGAERHAVSMQGLVSEAQLFVRGVDVENTAGAVSRACVSWRGASGVERDALLDRWARHACDLGQSVDKNGARASA